MDQPTRDIHNRRHCSVNRYQQCLKVVDRFRGDDWAWQEFADAPLGDRRLSRRLVMSVQRQAEDPMCAFTGLAGSDDWAAVKGYYRLIDRPEESAVIWPATMTLRQGIN